MMGVLAWIILIVSVSLVVLIINLLVIDKNIIYSQMQLNSRGKGTLIRYYLPETLYVLKVKSTIGFNPKSQDKPKIVLQEFTLTLRNQSDQNSSYYIIHKSNPFSSDILDLQLSEDGLLQNVKVISEDNMPEVFSTLTSRLEGDKQKVYLQVQGKGISEEPSLTFKQFSREFRIRSSLTIREKDSDKKFEQEWKINLNEGTSSPPMICDAGFKMISTPIVDSPIVEGNSKNMNPLEKKNTRSDTSIPGLLFREKHLVNLSIETKVTNHDSVAKRTELRNLSIFNKERVFNIPIISAAFVKRTQALLIEAGELRSHSVEVPSSIAGWIAIPIDIGKAIVSIPAQLVSLHIGSIRAKKELDIAKRDLHTQLAKDHSQSSRNIALEKELLKIKNQLAETKIDASLDIRRLEDTIEKLSNS